MDDSLRFSAPGLGTSNVVTYGLGLQPDGMIVAAGSAQIGDLISGGYGDVFVACNSANGELDTTFSDLLREMYQAGELQKLLDPVVAKQPA